MRTFLGSNCRSGLACAALASALCSAPAFAHSASDKASDAATEAMPANAPAQPSAMVKPAAGTVPAEDNGGVKDIVVTAQRREQHIQDVPITISAVSAEELRTADVRNVGDLTNVVPGFRAHLQTNYFQPFIRGVGGTSTLPGNEAAVATYIDGLYVGYKFSNNFELANIERVEVLKGPQGTLFGRNATGGAVNIITVSPTSELQNRTELSYGRWDNVIASSTFTGPITDTLGFVASARYELVGEGYQRNLLNGDEFGVKRHFQAMGKLRWEPIPDLRITAEYIHTDRWIRDDDSTTPNAAIPARPATVPGVIITYKPFTATVNSDPINTLNDQKYIFDMRYKAGGVSLASITGYIDSDAFSSVERDRSSAPLGIARSHEYSKQFTQEFQLSSDAINRFHWIAGLYYFRTDEGYKGTGFESLTNVPGTGTIADLASVFGRAGIVYRRTLASQIALSWAGFAEATFDVSDNTRLTAGIRYTWEKRDFEGQQFNVTAPPPGNALVLTPFASANLTTSFRRFTYRAVLDHHFTPDIMVFASYNTGFRSGAYNPTLISNTQIPLRPELINAAELGIKSDWLDRRLRINASAFYYDYRDLHVAIRTPDTGVITQQNAGGARVYGLDLDFVLRPSRRFSLSGGFNLLHARYTDFANAALYVINTAAGGGVQVTIPNAKGEPLNFSPKFSGNLAAQYELPLADGSQFALEGNYFYTSGFSRQIGMGDEIKAYGNLNASVTWRSPDRSYFVKAWGRNLTNHKILGSQLDSFAYFYIVQRPVSYGATLGFCLAGRGC